MTSVNEAISRDIDEMVMTECVAHAANAPEAWDKIWTDEGEATWRADALVDVYDRIVHLMPKDARAVDVGGGIGLLARRLRDMRQVPCRVVESSPAAVVACVKAGIDAQVKPVGDWDRFETFGANVFVSTECLEHLSEAQRAKVLESAQLAGRAFFSVPNDRLGPDEEPQHTIKFTAMSFKRLLQGYFKDVRVEVHGPGGAFLLGVCGFPKQVSLSVTMPVRNEAADLARTLASFRGVADEIVIGIDPRSTDGTREIALKYADVVFDLVELQGPPGDEVQAENGFHFAHARNQCLDKCTSDWIFMTEGHERLLEGVDHLLALHEMPAYALGACVLRTGDRQQWGFPWLTKRSANFRYFRSTHNALEMRGLEDKFVALPHVKTRHDRDHAAEQARRKQRQTQNRLTLMEDWLQNQNLNSLFYLGAEWREYDEAKARRFMHEYIVRNRSNGQARYQTRLQLAKLHSRAAIEAEEKGDAATANEHFSEARQVLIEATGDDWSRTEHWWWLGDLAMKRHAYEEAIQFYQYAAIRMGNPPFTLYWIDLATYEYLPAQRLAQAYDEIGDLQSSLFWARKVLEGLPDDLPEEFFDEARSNIAILEEAVQRLTAAV